VLRMAAAGGCLPTVTIAVVALTFQSRGGG
jgi:hypothetical protein